MFQRKFCLVGQKSVHLTERKSANTSEQAGLLCVSCILTEERTLRTLLEDRKQLLSGTSQES